MAFKKGQSGNPKGKAKGTLSWRGELHRQLREAGPLLVHKLIQDALNGDSNSMRVCIDKIIPRAKDNLLDFQIPDLKNKTPEQLCKDLFEAMSGQEMTADEIKCVLEMIKTFRSNDDQSAVKEMISETHKILEDLRAKNEREY